MLDPVITSEGVAVVHLFCTRAPGTDDEAVVAAVKSAMEYSKNNRSALFEIREANKS